MDRLTKLFVAAIVLAAIQTVTTVAFFQSTVSWSSAAFCWFVVLVVGKRRFSKA